ncbi:hypothetical protein HIM_10230 [Hirsutella minnesotensis 3608]|uniref:Uncharacterized protein n=1 Tax=Hirsutella minnesotensis 3608 TaxID=1043627 RepID=A0A0F7ZG72_9HYPO|nr:hypothetical protein HIM_10230 [Hirsutella minnesotensis 3608]
MVVIPSSHVSDILVTVSAQVDKDPFGLSMRLQWRCPLPPWLYNPTDAYFNQYPDSQGFFGPFGGSILPHAAQRQADAIEIAYLKARQDPNFWEEISQLRQDYQGRPTPLYHAKRFSIAATAATHFGMKCEIHVGASDMDKKSDTIARMRLLGAEICQVTTRNQGIK